MLYAKVVVGLPVEGPFDYIVPAKFVPSIKAGSRVRVPFGTRKIIGYVVKTTTASSIKNLKIISELIDREPLLDKNMLALAKELADYYCCSLGEAVETVLPQALRKGKKIADINIAAGSPKINKPEAILIQDIDTQARWDIYLKEIREALNGNKSSIILLPDLNLALKAKDKISSILNVPVGISYRNQPGESEEWVKLKQGELNIVVGTRSAVFAPFSNLGLVIIDEEQDSVYKQDQVPHYHARTVALMRVKLERAKLILGATTPSMESFFLAKTGKIKYNPLPRKNDFPEVKLIDARHERTGGRKSRPILSRYLQDAIYNVLNSSGKALLFMNRSGFATFASCRNCGFVLKCPRCNINLVYHFKGDTLNCHYCNFKTEAPKICPNCNSNYIRYTGVGLERIESELSRLFPQARILRIESAGRLDREDAGLFVATSSIIKEEGWNFDLIGVIGIDNALNRIDLASSEKTFFLLAGLLKLTSKLIIIQTGIANHICFEALRRKDLTWFYEEELKTRKQLGFPPYKHVILIKLRGEREERVKQAALSLFEKLTAAVLKNARMVSVNPGQPSKLRGKFYWQLMASSGNVKKACALLKNHLKDFLHSGIIVTVDVDPV